MDKRLLSSKQHTLEQKSGHREERHEPPPGDMLGAGAGSNTVINIMQLSPL